MGRQLGNLDPGEAAVDAREQAAWAYGDGTGLRRAAARIHPTTDMRRKWLQWLDGPEQQMTRLRRRGQACGSAMVLRWV